MLSTLRPFLKHSTCSIRNSLQVGCNSIVDWLRNPYIFLDPAFYFESITF